MFLLFTFSKKIVINKLMQDFNRADLEAIFPRELSPEMCFDVYLPCKELSKAFTDLLNKKTVTPNQKIKILATDTTSGDYYCKKSFAVKGVLKMK